MTTAAPELYAELYAEHPGDCHTRRDGDAYTACCRECAGTGWFDGTHPGEEPWGFDCVPCRGTGRAFIVLAGLT